MKIQFYCDSGANIHSQRKETFTPEQLGITDEEWEGLTDEEKDAFAIEWAYERLEIGWKRID